MKNRYPIIRERKSFMIYWVVGVLAVLVIFGPHAWAERVLATHNREEYFSGSGFDLARILLERMGRSDIRVEAVTEGSHYDPVTKAVRLNSGQCGGRSLTAVVVAVHEVGHAIQDHTGYRPLALRTRWVMGAARAERIGAGLMLAVPLITGLTRIPAAGFFMGVAGFLSLGLPILIHALTLPVEWDASFNRALPILETGEFISAEDLPAAKKILRACALTYIAGALVSLLNFFRWIRILRRG